MSWIWQFLKSTPSVFHVFIAVADMVYHVAIVVYGRHGIRPVCLCVSGVIIGCKLSTTQLIVWLSQPTIGSLCTVFMMSTVCGLTSLLTTGDQHMSLFNHLFYILNTRWASMTECEVNKWWVLHRRRLLEMTVGARFPAFTSPFPFTSCSPFPIAFPPSHPVLPVLPLSPLPPLISPPVSFLSPSFVRSPTP